MIMAPARGYDPRTNKRRFSKIFACLLLAITDREFSSCEFTAPPIFSGKFAAPPSLFRKQVRGSAQFI
jgi:hypothetical protein